MPRPRTSRSRKQRDWSQIPNMVTALTAVAALVFTGLSLQFTRDQLDIAYTQQITERYIRAVDQLDDDRTTDVRLGAVFTLERIARDSAADREAVGHLLAAFVRRKRPLNNGPCGHGLDRDEADIAAALRVVSTRQLISEPNLSATCLSGTNMDGARLRCAVLTGANLQGETTLVGADLRQANLIDALLNGTDPDDPDPSGANLNYADLESADLTWANLNNAYLIKADLRGANLYGATLASARLHGADLRNARLGGVDLREADLSGVKWAGAHIGDSTFSSPAARAKALAGGAVDNLGKPTARTCGA